MQVSLESYSVLDDRHNLICLIQAIWGQALNFENPLHSFLSFIIGILCQNSLCLQFSLHDPCKIIYVYVIYLTPSISLPYTISPLYTLLIPYNPHVQGNMVKGVHISYTPLCEGYVVI